MGERIYLAGRWRDRYRLRRMRTELQARGHTVTSRWIDDDGRPDDYLWSESDYPASVARRDLSDVNNSTLLILDLSSGTSTRGGMYWECGFFMGAKRDPSALWILGTPINVFTYMPEHPHFPGGWEQVYTFFKLRNLLVKKREGSA